MRNSLKIMALATLGICLAGILPAAAQDGSQSESQAGPPPGSLADAARKARAQRKNAPPPKQVWTNENIPKVPREEAPATGAAPAGEAAQQGPGGEAAGAQGAPTPGEKTPSAEDEAKKQAQLEAEWRGKFAAAHKKLDDDEKELDIMQREYNLKRQQYYSDPNTAMREQYEYPSGRGGELNDLAKKIEDKKQAIEQDKQAVSDLEDQLRKAGLPSGWARTP
jgi:hypothetical protein